MSTTTQVTEQDLELENIGEIAQPIKPLREIRNIAERRAIVSAIAEAGGNVSRVAELLEITRPTLYSLLNKFDLKVCLFKGVVSFCVLHYHSKLKQAREND